MKTINELAQFYADQFETKTRDNGTRYVILKNEDNNEDLHDAIRDAHGDRLPDDFIYGTFADLLQTIAGYNLEDINALDDNRFEIIDSNTDIYTADLTAWLASDINNVYYITQALEEYQPKDGFNLLAVAQSMAIDEVFSAVYEFLSDKYEEQEEEQENE